jgi:hypothetical protein
VYYYPNNTLWIIDMKNLITAVLLLGCGVVQAAVIEIATHDEGRLDGGPGGFYVIGDQMAWSDSVQTGGGQTGGDFPSDSSGTVYHVFDLSGVEGYVESASFRIWLGIDGYRNETTGPVSGVNPLTNENLYYLHKFDYLDEILSVREGEADLWADYSEPVWDEVYALIHSGHQGARSYGSIAVEEDDEGSWIVVNLNSLALQNLNSSLGSDFAIAGYNPIAYCMGNPGDPPLSTVCWDSMFTSADSGNAVLSLNVTAVPIPAAVWLFSSALGGLGWMRRRRAI